ncbi:hypothetical protein Sm713_03090 [Streptomyces sp. TS71-3]|nr:hypothetical protein Sm713_03090 [Streptomyces sp. TS71-3]
MPPVVMAALFIGVIVTMVKSQGGANKAKEDAAVDAALAARGEEPHPAAERTAAAAGAATTEGAKGDAQG